MKTLLVPSARNQVKKQYVHAQFSKELKENILNTTVTDNLPHQTQFMVTYMQPNKVLKNDPKQIRTLIGLRSFLCFALRILTAHNLWRHL